jgi:hypothetical protein
MRYFKTLLLCVAGSWCVGVAAVEVRISTPVQILGAEAFCAGWLPGVDANGDATLTCVPTGGGWNGTCPGFANTRVLNMSFNDPQRLFTSNAGGFGPNDAVVVAFRTGSVSSGNQLPRITASESLSIPSARVAVLSNTPCDFGAQTFPGAGTSGTTVTVPFAVGAGPNFGFYPILQLKSTYYFNIKNAPNPACAAGGNCNMEIDLTKPAGL